MDRGLLPQADRPHGDERANRGGGEGHEDDGAPGAVPDDLEDRHGAVSGRRLRPRQRDKIDPVKARLPSGANDPQVLRFDPSALPILSLAVSSDTLSDRDLTALTQDIIVKRLSNITGVGSASVVGGVPRQLNILIDPDRLTAIRNERKHNSRYSSYAQCEFEVREVELLFQRENIPHINSTHFSVEEISAKILVEKGVERRFK